MVKKIRKGQSQKKEKHHPARAVQQKGVPRVIQSALQTPILHPKNAARIRTRIRKKHDLDQLYQEADRAQAALDALHEYHKPVEVKVSEVLAKHARHKHYERLMKANDLPPRKKYWLTRILGALVVLSALQYVLELTRRGTSGNAVSALAISPSSSASLNLRVGYLVFFLVMLALLILLRRKKEIDQRSVSLK